MVKPDYLFKPARFFLPVVLLVLWSTVLYRWTGGCQAYTTYSSAMHKAGPLPRPVPNFKLVGMNNESITLDQFKGKTILLDIMYLQCSSVCGILRSRLGGYYNKLSEYIPNDLVILSISFDTIRDNPDTLKQAWSVTGKKPGWIFAIFKEHQRIDDRSLTLSSNHYNNTNQKNIDVSVEEILQEFGVVVFKNNHGDFNHSAYHYLIDPGGNLVKRIEPSRGYKKNLISIQNLLNNQRQEENAN